MFHICITQPSVLFARASECLLLYCATFHIKQNFSSFGNLAQCLKITKYLIKKIKKRFGDLGLFKIFDFHALADPLMYLNNHDMVLSSQRFTLDIFFKKMRLFGKIFKHCVQYCSLVIQLAGRGPSFQYTMQL